MKSVKTRSILDPFRTTHSPGLNELFSLLQTVRAPALLINFKQEIVLASNAEFQKLIGYPANEIASKAVQYFFDGEIDFNQLKLQEAMFTLVTRQQTQIQALTKLSMLGMENIWAVLTFTIRDVVENQKSETSVDILAGLELINDFVDDVPTWMRINQNQLVKALNSNYLAYYELKNDSGDLTRVFGVDPEKNLPETLPNSDLLRLLEPVYWEPGKRVLTELHRVARIANLSYVYSILIEINADSKGLFVICDRDKKPPRNLLEFLKFFSEGISRRSGQQNAVGRFQESIGEKDHWLDIYSQVFENSQEGICCLDTNLKVVLINNAAEWMLGYSEWEVKDETVENVLIGPKTLLPALDEALAGITTHNMGESVLHHRDGHPFPVQIQVNPVIRDNVTTSILVFFRDISEHEQIIARTQQLEHRALLGDVTSVFAHEVRNPINNISTGIQLVSSRINQEDPNQEVLTRVQGDCVRLNELMESVLAFSRPVEQKFENINLFDLLSHLLDRWHPRMSKVNVKPFIQGEECLPRVYGNYRSLEQVFINLISNAVDAMSKEGGTLAIKCARGATVAGQEQVEITVSDNGPGIPEEIQKKLFEPFVTNKPHGTGLGLAITKKIIAAHKGTIQVESFAGGTIFHVVIPASDGEPA